MRAWCILLVGSLPILTLGCGGNAKNRVVVYCAHDQEFAAEVLKKFEERTGLQVAARYDTEANKSIQFYEDLVREAGRPRCDVHWNNEIAATIRLQKQGIYQSYASPAARPFPAKYKSGDDTWTAFAARARVLLVNTDRVAEKDRPRGMMDLIDPRWHGQVVMAKPQFGTTGTHAACLFQFWGEARAREYFQKLHENEVRIVAGNKNVAVEVGKGNFAIGLTDTDDAMAEIEAKHPVALIFPDGDPKDKAAMGTLFIPNSAAIIKNCPNPAGAHKLVDFLLSPEVETMLAEGPSRQIPLNPQVKAKLPRAVESAPHVKVMEVDFVAAAENWEGWQRILVKTLNVPD